MGAHHDKLPKRFQESSFVDLMKHMDSFFEQSLKHFDSFFNRQMFDVDLYETESDIVVESFLPGCQRDQIKLDIIDQYLRLSVDDSATLETKNDQSKHLRKEQYFQRMERLIPLPFPISEKDTKVTFEDETLKIFIPKKMY